MSRRDAAAVLPSRIRLEEDSRSHHPRGYTPSRPAWGVIRLKRALRAICVVMVLSVAVLSSLAAGRPGKQPTSASYPIKHVVVIFQENNSFDHLLGKLCVDENNRCDGTTEGKLSDGQSIPLKL